MIHYNKLFSDVNMPVSGQSKNWGSVVYTMLLPDFSFFNDLLAAIAQSDLQRFLCHTYDVSVVFDMLFLQDLCNQFPPTVQWSNSDITVVRLIPM